MKIPTIKGVIDRRILVNYRIDSEVVQRILPEPFEPKTVSEYAIAGICLIRLVSIRPKCSIPFLSIDSENAAHRFAVRWMQDGKYKEGVYIPRRDTSSLVNAMTGGTVFPGVHHKAKFEVEESDTKFSVKMTSSDNTIVEVIGNSSLDFPKNSIFESLRESSKFFEKGCLGYSDTNTKGKFDGLELCVFDWKAEPLKVSKAYSSYFENTSKFPKGSVQFDHALLMLGLEHEWHGKEDLVVDKVNSV